MTTLRELIERPAWMDQAACRHIDADLFFPARGESLEAAIAVCTECPVRAHCLAYALTNGERYGVWGGTSEKQRRQIRAERAKRLGLSGRRYLPGDTRPPIDHGTTAGNAAHRARGEEPCPPCKEAQAAYVAERRAKRKLQAVPG